MGKKQEKSIILRFFSNVYVKNLLLMSAIFLALIFVVLFLLNSYTKHDEAVEVPQVKGLQVAEAISILNAKGLRFDTIVTSVQGNATPGSIYDQVPKGNSKVKKGHIIFLMINSKEGQMVSLPAMADLSQRQALTQLNAKGFNNIIVKEEPSPYKGIVLSLQYRGNEVTSDMKIPIGATLTMIVGAGGLDAEGDSINHNVQADTDKSFF